MSAHKVRDFAQKEGINVFVYTHGSEAQIDWRQPDIVHIASSLPGRRTEMAVEIAPGGNSVISYLDVATADATPYAAISQALEAAEQHVDGKVLVVIPGPIAIRFGTTLGNRPNARREFSILRWRLLEVLGRHLPWHHQHPLIIVERRLDSGRVYELEHDSAERLEKQRDGQWSSLPLRLSDDVKYDFEQIHGPIAMHVAGLITGLSNDDLLAMGGYVIIDDKGIEQLRWPTLAPVQEASETILGQITGYWYGPRDEIPAQRVGYPTGAVLPALNGTFLTAPCLDLVRVNYLWLPLSTAGSYTYSHTIGLSAGEVWRFVPADEPWPTVTVAELLPPLPSNQISTQFGADADSRARHDRDAIQLGFRRQDG